MFQANKANRIKLDMDTRHQLLQSFKEKYILSNSEMQKSPPGCTPIRLPIKKHPKLSNSSHTKPRDNPRQAQAKPITI